MSANRERGFSNPSVDQMFPEGKRHWYRIIDKDTSKTIEMGESSKSWVERNGEVITTHPVPADPYHFVGGLRDEGKPSRTYSLRNVTVEGNVKASG